MLLKIRYILSHFYVDVESVGVDIAIIPIIKKKFYERKISTTTWDLGY